MNLNYNIYGAKAELYIKDKEQIDILAKKISDGLIIPEFILENSEYPPYHIIGSCEVLGFEIWLEPSNIIENWTYILKIETEDCLNEVFSNQMYDLSLWLSRFISKMCDIETLVVNIKDKSGIMFKKGEPTMISNIKINDNIEK